jgi:hypothetical protein
VKVLASSLPQYLLNTISDTPTDDVGCGNACPELSECISQTDFVTISISTLTKRRVIFQRLDSPGQSGMK